VAKESHTLAIAGCHISPSSQRMNTVCGRCAERIHQDSYRRDGMHWPPFATPAIERISDHNKFAAVIEIRSDFRLND
jgi:hypothetical protein